MAYRKLRSKVQVAGGSMRDWNKPPLGSGKRFKALVKKLRARGAKNPEALAAFIGRKKYGKKRFQKLAARGRKRRRK